MREYKYGIISDIHAADPRLVYTALDTFKKRKVDAVILNGDVLGNRYRGPDLKPEEYLHFILHVANELGLETYVQPGSHEPFSWLHNLIKALKDKYNIHYTVDEKALEAGNHKLIFLPGSDWAPGNIAGYRIHDREPTGVVKYVTGGGMAYYLYNTNPNDLRRLIEDPQNTILVSHIPRRFSTENAVDVAHFIEKLIVDLRVYNKPLVQTRGVAPLETYQPQPGVPFIKHNSSLSDEELREIILETAKRYSKNRDVIAIDVERITNRGNETLAKILEEEGVTKGISGHFHNSVWNAHDAAGEYIPPKKPTSELFWNASLMDEGKFCILHVLDGEVYYTNLEIKG